MFCLSSGFMQVTKAGDLFDTFHHGGEGSSFTLTPTVHAHTASCWCALECCVNSLGRVQLLLQTDTGYVRHSCICVFKSKCFPGLRQDNQQGVSTKHTVYLGGKNHGWT